MDAPHFQMFAAYNAWANAQVYGAAAALTEDEFHRGTGAFFGSLSGTLNHLLAADRIWMKRFTGEGEAPDRLDAVIHDDLSSLRSAREAEDARIVSYADRLDDAMLAGLFHYTPISNPEPVSQRLGSALSHLFNHHTHHRGQAHMILTTLGQPSLALDLAFFLRREGKKWA